MPNIDEDMEPLIDEEDPPRSRLRRLVRWFVLVSVATVGITAVLMMFQEPI